MVWRRARLYDVSEVPEHFQESFILVGYRNPSSSVSQCFRSVFQMTNETLNIWTHLVPTIIFGWHMIVFCRSLDATSLPHLTPLLVYVVTTFAVPFASTLAHVFNAMSYRARHVCFLADYWVVSLFGFSSAAALRAYSFTEWQSRSLYAGVYLPGAALLCCGCFLMSCSTRSMKTGRRRKALRVLSFGLPYFYYFTPLLLRLLADSSHREADHLHWRQIIFGLIAAFLYGSHIPERFCPGKFDFVGHSHQLFHVTAVLGSHYELQALTKDAIANQPSSNVSYSTVLLLMAFVSVINSTAVLRYANYLDYNYRLKNVNCAPGLVNPERESRLKCHHQN